MSTSTSPTTYFVSDERMLLHKNEWDPTHIETPSRLRSILDILTENQVLEKCTVLESKEVKLEDLYLVHSVNYVDEIRQTQFLDKVSTFNITFCELLPAVQGSMYFLN